MTTDPSRVMSIGALARATGVPADTLRTWERRYGFPSPERTDSGHRRYSIGTLERLRLVVRALEQGHRPSTVLTADEAGLRALVSAAEAQPVPRAPALRTEDAPATIERWLEHVERFEGRAFERELQLAAAEYGDLAFLQELAGPFLAELGQRWANGRLQVRHEHFASERLRELLTRKWRPLSDAATGPTLICATPSGEQHVLGLHMATLALALHNARILFLGAQAPADEIAAAAEHHAADAVVLSAAVGCDRALLQREVETLRARLPESVPIVGGGGGFWPPLHGVVTQRKLSDLLDWWARRHSLPPPESGGATS